jgi:hypothetical protein
MQAHSYSDQLVSIRQIRSIAHRILPEYWYSTRLKIGWFAQVGQSSSSTQTRVSQEKKDTYRNPEALPPGCKYFKREVKSVKQQSE